MKIVRVLKYIMRMKLMIVKETKKEDARQGSLENIIDLTQ